MQKVEFNQVQETLYYDKLANGLDVYILPKPEFNKTYVTFTTKYGSIDNHFKPLGQNEFKLVPDGIAHFLEHKMFEKEDGDVFQKFSEQGASANAFTSFNKTAYLFSCTDNVEMNLKTLLDMVQEPYFTEQTVEKEKGIIGQEIMMYDDDPDWRVYFGVIENMYHHHPVKIDIAGTVESISKITAELLYECYHTFYHPSNMLLFIVGPVDAESMMDFIRKDQEAKDYDSAPTIERYFEEEPETVASKKQILEMNVQVPKCLVGVKATKVNLTGKEMLKYELAASLILDLLFSRSSDLYEKLVSEELIDNSFQFSFSLEQGFGFAIVGGNTKHPDKLAERIQKILLDAKNGKYLSKEALERAKKKRIGGFLRSLNSPEYIANQFTRYLFNDMNLFDVVPVLEELTYDDIIQVANELFAEERMTACQVLPKS